VGQPARFAMLFEALHLMIARFVTQHDATSAHSGQHSSCRTTERISTTYFDKVTLVTLK